MKYFRRLKSDDGDTGYYLLFPGGGYLCFHTTTDWQFVVLFKRKGKKAIIIPLWVKRGLNNEE